MSKEHIRTTCPRDCYDACGIVAVKRDGKVTKILGDPEHPVSRGTLCGKCALAYNGVWRDPAARLTRPLKRSGPKGSGQFEAISWDEAMAVAAERLGAVIDQQGGHAILNAHYTGTCSQIAGHFPQRLMNRIGATEVDPDTICNNAGHVAVAYVNAMGAVEHTLLKVEMDGFTTFMTDGEMTYSTLEDLIASCHPFVTLYPDTPKSEVFSLAEDGRHPS